MTMKRFDLDVWEEILVTLTRNKTRSLLTAFGIFWGIFMLVALMGGAQGMQQMLSREFEGFATNSGFMGSNKTGKAYKGFQQGRTWDLENADVERIRRSVGEVEVITPSQARWGINIIYGERSIDGTLKGLYPEYGKIEEPLISHGRYLNDMDVRERRRVCIIGKRIYETLFPGGENPCGKSVKINGIYYQVIGVSMSTGNISVQGRSETSVIIPFTTMQQNYNLGQKVQLLCYTAKKGYSISEVEEKVAQVVKRAHYIHPDDSQALVQVNAEAMFSMMDNRRCHRREQHHDGDREGTHHGNRHPPRHRGATGRHPPANPVRKHGAYRFCGHGRHHPRRVPPRCGGNRAFHARGRRTFPDQLRGSRRGMPPVAVPGPAGRVGTGLPRHVHQADRCHPR